MTNAIETIARGDDSKIAFPREMIARDNAEWHSLWAAHAGSAAAAPPVDFERRIVAAVFAGQLPSPRFQLSIVGTRRDGETLAVLVETRLLDIAGLSPAPVAPFHIVSLPRYDGEVRFTAAVASSSQPLDSEREPSSPSSSSTGLMPRTAGALAYLAGPFSGALLLAVERTSPTVRFHAWQAVIGLGGLGLIAVGCLALAFLILVVSPTGFWTLLWLAALLGVSWVIAWAVCVVQAYRGRRWKMPLAGKYAERLAGFG